ncbi:MAG: hypothetical protein EP343_21505 [Deltaproteobacteria bacterium]|nr:MAG: hypothetical protein EP343_21505 [Deltaproteobacteria bacterium]
MRSEWRDKTHLPKHIQDAVATFCEKIEKIEGDNLVSIVLYGSGAKGGYNEYTSNINIVLVLEEASIEVLDRLAGVIHYGSQEFGIGVMVSEPHDLDRSTDVFPIKFRDIQRHYVILSGEDLIESLSIEETHLRLRCEQEFKNLMWRMRYFYLHRKHRSEQVEATLMSVTSEFLIATEALLYLETGESFTTKEEIVDAAAKELDFPASLLKKLLSLKQTKLKPNEDELRSLYQQLMELVTFAADLADRWTPDEDDEDEEDEDE